MLRTLFWLATIFKKEVKSGPGKRGNGNAGGIETAVAMREGVWCCECVPSDQVNGSNGCLRLRQRERTRKIEGGGTRLSIKPMMGWTTTGPQRERAFVLFSHTHTQTRAISGRISTGYRNVARLRS